MWKSIKQKLDKQEKNLQSKSWFFDKHLNRNVQKKEIQLTKAMIKEGTPLQLKDNLMML